MNTKHRLHSAYWKKNRRINWKILPQYNIQLIEKATAKIWSRKTVCQSRSCAVYINDWTDLGPVRDGDSWGSKAHGIRWGSDPDTSGGGVRCSLFQINLASACHHHHQQQQQLSSSSSTTTRSGWSNLAMAASNVAQPGEWVRTCRSMGNVIFHSPFSSPQGHYNAPWALKNLHPNKPSIGCFCRSVASFAGHRQTNKHTTLREHRLQ